MFDDLARVFFVTDDECFDKSQSDKSYTALSIISWIPLRTLNSCSVTAASSKLSSLIEFSGRDATAYSIRIVVMVFICLITTTAANGISTIRIVGHSSNIVRCRRSIISVITSSTCRNRCLLGSCRFLFSSCSYVCHRYTRYLK